MLKKTETETKRVLFGGLSYLWLRVFGVGDGHKNFDKNATSLRASGNCDKLPQVVLLSIYSLLLVNTAFTFLL